LDNLLVEGNMKLYKVIIWDNNPESIGVRDTVYAEGLTEARQKVIEQYGEGKLVSIYNEEDAGRTR
jgi:hypothetical protein